MFLRLKGWGGGLLPWGGFCSCLAFRWGGGAAAFTDCRPLLFLEDSSPSVFAHECNESDWRIDSKSWKNQQVVWPYPFTRLGIQGYLPPTPSDPAPHSEDGLSKST